MLSLPPKLIFFKFLAFFRPVSLFLTCKYNREKLVELQFYQTISLQYSVSSFTKPYPCNIQSLKDLKFNFFNVCDYGCTMGQP